MSAGAHHGILPVGLDALDITRVEAGFVLGGVDYTSARAAWNAEQSSTPYELDLGWAVQLERAPFIGQDALRREARAGSRRALVGLEIDWPALEALYERVGLPPHLPTTAWRTAVPVFEGAVQVGRATSGAWSPTLKKNLALALLPARLATPGTEVRFEITAEYRRHSVAAKVVKPPFFDPERKRS
jgi:aminomethyltransferase